MADFKIEPIYERFLDSIFIYTEDTPSFVHRVNSFVSVMLADDDNRIVGIEFKGVSVFMQSLIKGLNEIREQ